MGLDVPSGYVTQAVLLCGVCKLVGLSPGPPAAAGSALWLAVPQLSPASMGVVGPS